MNLRSCRSSVAERWFSPWCAWQSSTIPWADVWALPFRKTRRKATTNLNKKEVGKLPQSERGIINHRFLSCHVPSSKSMRGLSESSASVETAFRCDGWVSETWPPPLMCDSKSPTSFTLTVIFGSRLDTVDRKSGEKKIRYQIIQ